MANLRVGKPKFYIDAVLLARQWGEITEESSDGKFYLNPSNVTHLVFDTQFTEYYTLTFKNRMWANSLSHIFLLGHNFLDTSIGYLYKIQSTSDSNIIAFPFGDTYQTLDTNGWTLLEHDPETIAGIDKINIRFNDTNLQGAGTFDAKVGDFSLGWSYTMQHSPDLALTQNFDNESIKTQTTLGGHTLTNAGYNHPPTWIRQAWTTGTVSLSAEDRVTFPPARRSWSLKFSYLSDNDADNPLFPSSYNTSVGIFEYIASDEDNPDPQYNIKKDFLSKVWFGTNCGQLPFIFTPDSNETNPEYAICRITNTPKFEQVAHNTYDVSLDIVEVW